MAIQFVYPKVSRNTGSVQMRVRQVYSALRESQTFNCKLKGIVFEARVFPRRGVDTYVWVKPIKWYRLWWVSRRSRVLIDVLDITSFPFPKWVAKSPNVEFIATTMAQRNFLRKLYPDNKVHTIPHHYDPCLDDIEWVGDGSVKGILYLGSKGKFVPPDRSEVRSLAWAEFVSNPIRFDFHWAVRPRTRLFEPETKVATAAAVGAVPIVSIGELGSLLPRDYPFCIDDVHDEKEVSELMEKVRDVALVNKWKGRMLLVAQKSSLAACCAMYESLLSGK